MSDRLAVRTDSAEADGAATPRPVTLTELLAVPRRRWRWLLVFATAGAAAAVGYLTVLPAQHTATSVVTVRPVVLDSFSYPGPGADRAVNMNVEHSLATSGRVVHAVAGATGQGEQTVRDGLLVEVPVGGQLLRFGYTADSERTAITGANAAATAYLVGRRSDYEIERDTQLSSYDSSLAALTKKEQDAEHRAQKQAANSATPASVTADDQVRALNDQISDLTEQRARIAAIDLTPGSVTNRAARPVPSSRDHGFLYLIAGVIGGALLGAVAGYARESGDRRVRRAADAA
ncbi:MAG: lipopolysaccharide biosynthesis protein, partial [Actinocatenispora sp.]